MTNLKITNTPKTKSSTITNASTDSRKDVSDKSYGTGRRKNAVARVWVKPGSGNVIVNYKAAAVYFKRETHHKIILQPFTATHTLGKFDVFCTIKGGGLSGQAGALRHGIARALNEFDREEFRPELKKAGLLTRDSRVVERKKYGKRKARKSTQFSKR